MRWLRLIRLPTVFTAMADIFLGFLLVSGGQFHPTATFVLLLAASSCLYFAGMVLNDVFDLQKDMRERPDRPLPSGAISMKAACALATGLCLAGLLFAALASGRSAIVAGGIIVAVLAYDWLLKNTPLAPLAMGSCRSLNVLLGASTAATGFAETHLVIAVSLGVYIAGLTWFARREAGDLSRRDLLGGSVVMNAAIIALTVCVYEQAAAGPRTGQVLVLLVFILAVIDSRLVKAIRSKHGPDVGAGIRTALLSLVMIDASLVLAFTQSVPAALGTAALLIPASVIRRWIPLT